MISSERFRKALSFSRDLDRLPAIEWATWWNQTTDEWKSQGLPAELTAHDDICKYMGLDKLHQFWFQLKENSCPIPGYHGGPIVSDENGYEEISKHLFTDALLDKAYNDIKRFIETPGSQDSAIWYTLEGFFWFPRTILGIENHLYAFYDQPELMLRINRDLSDFHHKLIDVIYQLIKPEFMTFAEDLSYNHGPMLSKDQYDEFILPFYQELAPVIQSKGTKVLIDTDGFVEPLIPWFLEGGVEGILPLERMAGVDVNRIRQNFPQLIMIGGFDKTVMHLGEEAIRNEFERIRPAIVSGGYIPGVDHQTPPGVSMENYRTYLKLLYEYCSKYPPR
ncbi:hypothetical protein EOM86_04900 [Candidatus Nomurabacteria bacterium]|nr:uroporphyrinogen decarboxylase family protein [Eubacteriales bacterium]NCU26044.1 hypothetical protein [Candidatus Nomurabacteria bacterium]